MKTRTFVAKLRVRIGEYEMFHTYLQVANSQESAEALMETAASMFYGDGEAPREEGGYYANDGEIHVSAYSLAEIGLATFLEMSQFLTVHRTDNVVKPTAEDLHADVQCAAKALHGALERKSPTLGYSDVLNALAASWGEKNWQVLRAKVQAPDRALVKAMMDAADTVVSYADDEGCCDDLTVTSAQGVEALSTALTSLRRAGTW